MLKERLLTGCILLPILLATSCTNTSRFSYKQVNYSKEQIKEALASAPDTFKDSTITLALGPSYKKNVFHRWVWGKRHRDLWKTPVEFEVLDLATEKGGLTPVKRGGGMQTKSLRLIDKNGHEYNLRSVNKEPATALPKVLRKTFLAGVVRDQTSAMQPFGPLVVPKLAHAAGIFYLAPKYLFIPYDPALGEFAEEYGGMVALLEAQPDENHPDLKKFGDIKDIDDTQEVLEKRFKDRGIKIDAELFAKSRLFDMLIGDWDRHEGQWTWAAMEENGEVIYKPIPEDRDQIFYRLSDGWLSWVLTQIGPLKKLQSFGDKKIDVKSYSYNARFVDKRMLYALTRQQWIDVAKNLQKNLTDSAIAEAIRDLPKPIYDITGEELQAHLRARREQLPQVAEKFYELLAKEVEIPGTDQEDKFVVTRVNDNETLVELFTEGKDDTEQKVFSKTFYRNETDKVYLFGLRDEDTFEISGKVKKGITLVIVGGMGEDKVIDKSHVKGWTRRTKVFDTRHGMEIEGREAKNKTKKSVKVNAFDAEGY